MSSIPEEPQPARPWRPEDGREPVVWTWPRGDRPARRVWSAGQWRCAPVLARQEWEDGTTYYQVEVDLLGATRGMVCMYWRPQPVLRRAHGSDSEPSRGVDEERQGGMPKGAASPVVGGAAVLSPTGSRGARRESVRGSAGCQ